MKEYWKKGQFNHTHNKHHIILIGYGNSINWRMACKLVGDMIDTLTANATRNVDNKDEEHNDMVVLR